MNKTAGSFCPSRPSSALKNLAEQLGICVETLDDRSVELMRDLLDHGTMLVWKKVAHGELSAPKILYDACRPFRQKIERIRRQVELSPAVETALGAHFLLRQLRYASETLDGVGFEFQLTERRSATEREVLRVLLAERRRAESEKAEMQLLRRGQVHQQMSGTREVTSTRVGQILRGLYRQGLLLRQLHPDRGGKEVAFYGLAPSGGDLCQRLGLMAPEPSPGFDFSVELQEQMLDPRRVAIAAGAAVPATRVVAFCSFSGGVGRTTAVAHTAWELTARIAAGSRLLVVDLDFDAPALDDFFSCSRLGACRGLRGLVIDFYRQPKRRREGWLRRALEDGAYVLQPFPEQRPDLWYLPTGLGGDGASEESKNAREVLAREVTTTDPASFGHLLAELLPVTFAHTLIDCAAGFGDSAWLASMCLADHLLLYSRAGDIGQRGLRPLLANFLARQDRAGRDFASVSFVAGAVRPTDIRPAVSWAIKLFPNHRPEDESGLRTLDLPFDPELPARQAQLGVKSREYLEAIGSLVETLGVRAVLRARVLESVCAEITKGKHLRIIEGLFAGSRNRALAQDYFTRLASNALAWDPSQLANLIRGIQESNQVLDHQRVRFEPARTGLVDM